MNPLYNIWNYDYIQQMQQQQHHWEQVKQVQDTVKALRDFLNGMDRIEPPYQNGATAEICAVLIEYMNKHTQQ